MVKYIAGLIVLIVIAVGMLLPAFQRARESNCGQRDPVGSGFELEENVAVVEQPNDVAGLVEQLNEWHRCLLYTSPSPRDQRGSRMPSSA